MGEKNPRKDDDDQRREEGDKQAGQAERGRAPMQQPNDPSSKPEMGPEKKKPELEEQD